ncbi:MAG: FkbM family methyltransferase [Acidimicrobiales bacterium]|nr:FkbM family methyltransferase [Acidimicrobiales bacterium]
MMPTGPAGPTESTGPPSTLRASFDDLDGRTVEFECEPTIASHWVARDILAGKTYPILSFVDDVRVVLDVGANCGAAAVYFGHHYPDATVHAFEPGSPQRAVLERNVAELRNVVVHPVGLHATDQELPLYFGSSDSGMSSVIRTEWHGDEHEIVQLRSAAAWAAEHDVTSIDVLKVDVEGVEEDVLQSLSPLLPTVKVLYLEYDSRSARRTAARLLDPTHELFVGKMFLDQGEVTYLRKDLADHPGATEWLRSIFTPTDG